MADNYDVNEINTLRTDIKSLNQTISQLNSLVDQMNKRLDTISKNTENTVSAVKENTKYSSYYGKETLNAVKENTGVANKSLDVQEKSLGELQKGNELRSYSIDSQKSYQDFMRAQLDRLSKERQEDMMKGNRTEGFYKEGDAFRPNIASEVLRNPESVKNLAATGKDYTGVVQTTRRRIPETPAGSNGPEAPQMQ